MGFSAFNKQLFIDNIEFKVRLERDVRVSDLSVQTASNATANSEDYNVAKLISSVTFSSTSSYVLYKVDLTNYGNVSSGLLNITSNTSGINYQVCDSNGSNCTSNPKTKINGTLGASKVIYVKVTSTSTGTKQVNLDFDFEPYHTITYANFSESTSSFITEIMENDSYEYTFTSNVEEIEVTGAASYNYNKNTKKLTISNVSENIEIRAKYLLSDIAETQYTTSNPNNYVSFNNTLYRIVTKEDIGDGYGNVALRVKIMANSSIGSYRFGTSNVYPISDIKNTVNIYFDENVSNESKELVDTAHWMIGATEYAGLISKTDAENNLSWFNNSFFTLTPCTEGIVNEYTMVYTVMHVDNDATIGYFVSTAFFDTFPSMYLKEDVLMVGGSGTSTDPYRLELAGNALQTNPTVITGVNVTVNGTYQQLVTVTNLTGTVYYSVGTALDSSNYSSVGSTTIPTRNATGTYKVYYYIPAWQNYKAKSGSVTSVINGKSISVSFQLGEHAIATSGITPAGCITSGTSNSCTITLPTFTVEDGYYAYGWFDEHNDFISYAPGTNVTISENTTFYSVTHHLVNITYVANGATAIGESSSYCTYSLNDSSCEITLPSISVGNSIVHGWSTDPNATTGTLAGQTVTVSSNTTFYAITSKLYSVRYYSNGATSIGATLDSCEAFNTATSCTVVAPIITRPSGIVVGWNEDSSATTASISPGDNITLTNNSTRYYAITYESKNADFYLNGATSVGSDQEYCFAYNTATTCTVTAPTITRNKYTIVGWNTDPTAHTALYSVGNEIVLTNGSNDFYAITYRPIQVKFFLNTAESLIPKGSSTPVSENVTEICEAWNIETRCNITSPQIVAPEGYEAVGFNTSATATTSTWDINTTQSRSSTGTYYAITKEREVTLLNLESVSVSNAVYNSISATLTIETTLEEHTPNIPYLANEYQYLLTTESTCPTTGYTTSPYGTYSINIGDITSSSTFRICARTVSVDGTITGDIVSTTFQPQYALLDAGQTVNSKIKTVANGTNKSYQYLDSKVKHIERASSLPNGFTPDTNNTISSSNSPMPVYIYFDSQSETLYYYMTAGYILTNDDSRNLFSGFSELLSIDTSYFDTTLTTNMYNMFSLNSSLTSLNISGFDTSNALSMAEMFMDCRDLINLDVTSLDTSSVINMDFMFSGCSSLTSLDFSYFDTSNVQYMEAMFYECGSLASIDISYFDTSNVITMGNMFNGCIGLHTVNLTDIVTSSVTSMSGMFAFCDELQSLDLSSFDTSNVESFYIMFKGCGGLTSLDLSTFDTSSVYSMDYMFEDCSSLTTVYVSSLWTTNSVQGSADMFKGCTSIVGGHGTTYSSNHLDATYARIDTASTPGYFTDVMFTPAAPSIELSTLNGPSYEKSHSFTINITAAGGFANQNITLNYYWSGSPNTIYSTEITNISAGANIYPYFDVYPGSSGTLISGTAVKNPNGAGELVVTNTTAIYDQLGNYLPANSEFRTPMNFDNTPPIGTATANLCDGSYQTQISASDNIALASSNRYAYSLTATSTKCTNSSLIYTYTNSSSFTINGIGDKICIKIFDQAGNVLTTTATKANGCIW